jgi:cell division protein FtsL
MSEIQTLLEKTMQGSGKFKEFSLKMIRQLTEGEKMLLTCYLISIRISIPVALIPIDYQANMTKNGYIHQYVQNGILYASACKKAV